MLNEEAFVLVLGLVATGLLALGILEVFLPSRRPRPQWEPRRAARPSASATAREPAGPLPTVGAAAPPTTDPAGSRPGSDPPAPGSPSSPADRPGRGRPRRRRSSGPVRPVPAAGAESSGEAAPAAERCSRLLEARRYADVVAEATAALESGPDAASDRARLWGLIGLARQAEGDLDAARLAYDQALAAAPADERATWARHLSTLAVEAARAGLTRARAAGDGEGRVRAARQVLEWVEVGRSVGGDDPALAEVAEAARAALWPACEEAVAVLVHRQEFGAARRLAQEALADPACPPQVAAALEVMVTATLGGEVGQLSAEALRRLQEGREDEALGILARAEAVLGAIPDGGVPPKRRQELERRLWWGFTKLGLRRVETGRLEEAVEPLMRALAFQAVGPDRQQETRGPLARALRGVVETQRAEAQRLMKAGDREGARRLAERLRALLAAATERGLTRDELAGALEATDGLLDRLAQVP